LSNILLLFRALPVDKIIRKMLNGFPTVLWKLHAVVFLCNLKIGLVIVFT